MRVSKEDLGASDIVLGNLNDIMVATASTSTLKKMLVIHCVWCWEVRGVRCLFEGLCELEAGSQKKGN